MTAVITGCGDRLRATGFRLRFPSYREGYTALLADRSRNGQ